MRQASNNGRSAAISQLKRRIQASRLNYLLESLISIPSPSGDEFRAARFLESYLLQHGIKVHRQYLTPKRFNLIAQIGPRRKRPHILFNTHIDTVPDFAQRAGLQVVQGARLVGRGACDTKGSVTAMTAALIALAELPVAVQPHLTLAVMVGEENSGDGVARFCRSRTQYSWAVIGEPTGLTIANTQAGYTELFIEVFSNPCHGFCPIDNQSAIALSSFVLACNQLAEELSVRYPHSLFVRSLSSGSDDSFWYTRPYSYAKLLFNPFPDKGQCLLLKRVGFLAKKAEARYDGIKIRVTVSDSDNGLSTHRSSPGVTAISSGLGVVGRKSQLTHLPSWTDGSTLTGIGIETVIFGPGSLRNAHTNREFVPLNEIREAALVLAAACL